MGKRPSRETVVRDPPSSDSSDLDAASNVGEVPQEGPYTRSTPRAGSPMQVELEQEDSVTCQWEDCGVVFTHLPTLIDHIHNGPSKFQNLCPNVNGLLLAARPYWCAQIQLYVRMGVLSSQRLASNIPFCPYFTHSIPYRRKAFHLSPSG